MNNYQVKKTTTNKQNKQNILNRTLTYTRHSRPLSIYNGRLQEPMILTLVAERFVVELSLPVLMTVYPYRGSNFDLQNINIATPI